MKKIILSNGVEMPVIGMGTYPLNGEILTNTVRLAYDAGYRLFDTSDNYYNEEDLGISLQSLYNTTSANREELFIVTKISDELYKPGTLGGGSNKGMYFWKSSPFMQRNNAVRDIVNRKISSSLQFLKTDYIDMLLMHWPYPDYFEEIWYEMEQVYREGRVKAIGVCNCRERHFETLKKTCSILPMVNQFETSPLNTKENLLQYCNDNEIKVMAYSPLMNLRQRMSLEYSNYLKKLCDKYKKNNAQIILRFDIQRGIIPIPKSSNKERLESNINIFDFELLSSEMETLLRFNENRQYVVESKSCPGL